MIRQYAPVTPDELRATYGQYNPQWIAAARGAIERGDLIESTNWHSVADLRHYLGLDSNTIAPGEHRTAEVARIEKAIARWYPERRSKRTGYLNPPGAVGGIIVCLDHAPVYTAPPLIALAAAEMLGCEVRRVVGGWEHEFEVKAGVTATLMRCHVEHGLGLCAGTADCRRGHLLWVKCGGAMPDCTHLIRELGGKA